MSPTAHSVVARSKFTVRPTAHGDGRRQEAGRKRDARSGCGARIMWVRGVCVRAFFFEGMHIAKRSDGDAKRLVELDVAFSRDNLALPRHLDAGFLSARAGVLPLDLDLHVAFPCHIHTHRSCQGEANERDTSIPRILVAIP